MDDHGRKWLIQVNPESLIVMVNHGCLIVVSQFIKPAGHYMIFPQTKQSCALIRLLLQMPAVTVAYELE